MTGLYPPGTAVTGGGGWTPTLLGSALAAWWSADDHGTANMTDDGSGLISSWTDRIAGIAVTGTTTARPTWSASGINGKAALVFDGTANRLTSTSIAALPTGPSAGEVWCSCDQTLAPSDSTSRFAAAYGGGASAQDRKIGRRVQNSVNRAFATDSAFNGSDLIRDLSGPHVMGGFWAGTTMAGRVDGAGFSTDVATIATLNTATTRLAIGANNASAANFWPGGVRHVLVTTTLSAAQRMLLEGWLAWDAGLVTLLPNGHPYRTRRP